MRLIESFKNKKLILINIFLTLYVGINLIGGERGLISFYEKNKLQKELIVKEKKLIEELKIYDKKNELLSSNLDLDFIDTIYREKFKFGKKEEIIIKLK